MKVLLTGASGFVGSHILDTLRARGVPVVLLLRPTSDPRFIADHLRSGRGQVEVRPGAVTDPTSLRAACRDVTHVIHCAGATKAVRAADFYAVNHAGAANVVAAVNERADQIRRLVHISSLAACGPGTVERPAREEDLPQPVSEYGRSKLAGEQEVTGRARVPFTVIRPPAVYGPRDAEFLRLFKAVRSGWAPALAGGRQPLSLVFAPDLATSILLALEHPAAVGRTYHVAAPGTATGLEIIDVIAAAMGCRPRRLSLPGWLIRLSCAAAHAGSQLTRRASLLAHDKHRELLAPGWVTEARRLETELGFVCPHRLAAGMAATLAWYRAQGWLPSA